MQVVVTQPDRPSGRGLKHVPSPVKRAALARGLDVSTPERLRVYVEELRAWDVEAFVVASYGKIIPQSMLELVPVAFNVHPSLLPLYRGATPLQSALRDGREETAVTIIAMDAGMDTGDVLLQERLPIGERETYGELHDRTAALGARMVVEAIDRYADGTLSPRTQNELARELGISDEEIERTATRPLSKDDLMIDWSGEPKQILDHIRALLPVPAPRAQVDGEQIKVLDARLAAGEPDGSITGDDGYVHRGVALLRVVPANRAAMSGAAWRRSVVKA